MNSVK